MVTVDFHFFHCVPLGGAIGSRLLVTWVDLCLAMSCHVLFNRQLGNTGLNLNMVLDLLAMTSKSRQFKSRQFKFKIKGACLFRSQRSRQLKWKFSLSFGRAMLTHRSQMVKEKEKQMR